MSTTQNEALSIWVDRNDPDPQDWLGRSEVEIEQKTPGTLVISWRETQAGPFPDDEVYRTFEWQGSIADLAKELAEIRAGY